jgi:hypothetical protein
MMTNLFNSCTLFCDFFIAVYFDQISSWLHITCFNVTLVRSHCFIHGLIFIINIHLIFLTWSFLYSSSNSLECSLIRGVYNSF